MELVKVEVNQNKEQVVSGRMLHEALEVSTRYNDWFSRMIDYGFVENQDYIAITQKRVTAQGNETTYTDHVLKLDMAKEIAMIQRTDKGKEIRQYFIQVEKEFHNKALESTDDSIARRLRAEAMDRNSRTKQAQLISKFADKVSPVAHDLLLVHATELMLQKSIEYKPEIRPTYSAEQIGKQLGISANKVGRLTNAHGLKTEQYGLTVLSKSKHSVKQVPTFVYYKEVVPVLRDLLSKE